ncbi:hypothetical protein H4219_001146 [Mycoemilia scoparia]|uniref:Arrestin-like N-terminal domain-containing protein n=1 Tax=Mycoemilia scoparia TaxID=417184 RepID=A0A9W8A1B0_9FUNG|nr:hypothetical protein H4219_001146 [Mycoemilia scoparia]
MSDQVHFEICFPSHFSKVPSCRPGSSLAGTVVLRVNSPLAASYLSLEFLGVERVRCNPVSGNGEPSSRFSKTTLKPSDYMTKEFYRKELILWGDNKKQETNILGCDDSHRFHFSFTMPLVNYPTPRDTPDIEILYTLQAKLYSQVSSENKKEKLFKAIHTTPARHLFFRPVVHYDANDEFVMPRPYESTVMLRDVDSGTNKHGVKLHIIQCHSAFTPGEHVELLLLIPGSRAIRSASYQFKENIRCRKSSAPVIDENEVPTLWKYSRDFKTFASITFTRLDKSNLTQELGFLGRFMFTSLSSLPPCLNTSLAAAAAANTASSSSAMPSPIEPNTATTVASESISEDVMSASSPIYGAGSIQRRESRGSLASFRARYEQLPVVPVPLGHLLSKDSFRFARIRFIMPQLESICPVSSVFLDFEYSMQINVTVATSFGGNRRLVGDFPINIATTRTFSRDKLLDAPSNRSYRDSYSSLNLRLNSISDNASRVSSSPTLSDTHVGTAESIAESKMPNLSAFCENYPTVQSFIQQGQRIPSPLFEAVNIKANGN